LGQFRTSGLPARNVGFWAGSGPSMSANRYCPSQRSVSGAKRTFGTGPLTVCLQPESVIRRGSHDPEQMTDSDPKRSSESIRTSSFAVRLSPEASLGVCLGHVICATLRKWWLAGDAVSLPGVDRLRPSQPFRVTGRSISWSMAGLGLGTQIF